MCCTCARSALAKQIEDTLRIKLFGALRKCAERVVAEDRTGVGIRSPHDVCHVDVAASPHGSVDDGSCGNMTLRRDNEACRIEAPRESRHIPSGHHHTPLLPMLTDATLPAQTRW